MDYTEAAQLLPGWSLPEMDAVSLDAIMGGTAATLFGFGQPADAC